MPKPVPKDESALASRSCREGLSTSSDATLRQILPTPEKSFYNKIPKSPAVSASVGSSPALERTAAEGRGERILFVDDEGVPLSVGTMILEQHGYLVTGVPNGEAAVRELHDNPDGFDAVLTDLSMPGMSGLQLAHQIRKLRPDLPVILTSGYVNPEDEARAAKLRIHAILTKPVNTKDSLPHSERGLRSARA